MYLLTYILTYLEYRSNEMRVPITYLLINCCHEGLVVVWCMLGSLEMMTSGNWLQQTETWWHPASSFVKQRALTEKVKFNPIHMLHNLLHSITHTPLLFNRPILPELHQVGLLQVKPVPKSKLSGIAEAELLQAGHLSCHPTNSIKALKEDCTMY